MLERTRRVLTILLSNLFTRTTGMPLILTPALPHTVRRRVVAKLERYSWIWEDRFSFTHSALSRLITSNASEANRDLGMQEANRA